MIDIMLDIECLDPLPGGVVLQVTAVPFNLNGQEHDGELETFDILLHAGEQIAAGFNVDQDCLAWWMAKDPETRKSVFRGVTSVETFCDLFHDYVKRAVKFYKEYRMWSTSAKTDFGSLPMLFKSVKKPYPVYHRAERCARTFTEMVKLRHPKTKWSKLVTTHYALDDCNRQIDDLQIAYKEFRDDLRDKPPVIDARSLTVEEVRAMTTP